MHLLDLSGKSMFAGTLLLVNKYVVAGLPLLSDHHLLTAVHYEVATLVILALTYAGHLCGIVLI